MRFRVLARTVFLFGFITKVVLFPIKLPFKVAKFVVVQTTKPVIKVAKIALSNVSVQAGPVKVRPFDFQRS